MAKKKPDIRFQGFTEEWEESTFSQQADTQRGLTYSPTSLSVRGVRVLRSSNIDEDKFVISDDDVFVDESAVNIDYAQNNDILITSANGSSRLVGKHCIIQGIDDNSTVHGGFMLRARAKQPHFLNASMGSKWYTEFIRVFVAGGNGAIGNLNKADLDACTVQVPSETEQQRIGKFFGSLDELIAGKEQELEKLRQIRLALLEKMFPSGDSDTENRGGYNELIHSTLQKFGLTYNPRPNCPAIRFNGFTDDWTTELLNSISIINPPCQVPECFEYVDLESVSGTTLKYHRTESAKTAPSRAQRLAKKHDIFYQTVRPYQKNNYLFELDRNDFVFSTGYAQIRSQINPRFLFIALQRDSFLKIVLDNCTGTSFPAINANALGAISVLMPNSYDEQKKIGDFFYNFDELISSKQQEIVKHKTIKQSLFGRMFVN